MSNFSKRNNLTNNILPQKDSMNQELKNRLWNALRELLNENITYSKWEGKFFSGGIFLLLERIWDEFLKSTHELVSAPVEIEIKNLKKEFDQLPWHRIYDLIEFVASNCNDQRIHSKRAFINQCNKALLEENSAYTILNGNIIENLPQFEVESLATTLTVVPDKVKEHFEKSLKFLFDRNKPDYKNSIKEAHSSIEAYARIITNSNQTLGELIKEKKLKANHPTITKIIENLNGYANDVSGVRHSNKNDDETTAPDKKDALRYLVLTSGIINHL